MTHTTQQKSKNVPELRFSGFEGAWEEKRLGEVTTFFKGKGISKNDISQDGINKCIRYGELYTTYNEVIKDIKSKTNTPAKESFESQENDVIIPSSGETSLDIATASCVKESGVLLGGDLNVLRLQNQDGEFFAYYLSNFENKNIARLAQGNSVVHLYASHLQSLKINLPTLPEQQKIAGFLGVVDEWTQNLKAQKENLEQYKKAIMQQIFSQKVRFKDENSNNFPDWVEKKFDDLYGSIATKEYQIKNSEILGKGKYKVVDQGQDLVAGYSNESGKVFSLSSVIIFGDHTTILKYIDFEFVIGADGTKILVNKNQDNNIKFLYFLLESNPIQSEGYKRHFSILKQQRFLIPSLPEQQKIASFLTSLDNLIQSKQTQISQAETWKKGLMQKLFV